MTEQTARSFNDRRDGESWWARRVRVFFRRGSVFILILSMLGGLSGWLYGVQQSDLYTARATVYVSVLQTNDEADLFQGGAFVQNQMPSFAELTKTQIVLQPVVDETGIAGGVDELRDKLDVVNPPETSILTLSVQDESQEDAVQQANSIARSLTTAIVEASNTGAGAGTRLSVNTVEEASAAIGRSEGYIEQQVIVFGIGGTALAALLLMLGAWLDRRVRHGLDVATLTDAPVLEISSKEDITTDVRNFTYFNALVQSFSTLHASSRVWAVVSVGARSNGESLALALAHTLENSSTDVLVVDVTDSSKLGSNEVSRQAPLPEELFTILNRATSNRERSTTQVWGEGATISERPEPSIIRASQLVHLGWGLSQHEHVGQLLSLISSQFGNVVLVLDSIDSSPVSTAFAAHANAVVVVTKRDKTRMADIKRSLSILRMGSATTVAAVVMK